MEYTSDDKIIQPSEVSYSSQLQIQETFRTLLLQKKVKQKDLGYFLGLSKASTSRIVNGKQIPELRVRLKIAEYFAVDTSLIWRVPIILPADIIESKEVINHGSSRTDYEAFEVRPSPDVIAFQTRIPRSSDISICKKTEQHEVVSDSSKPSSSKTNGEEKT